MILLYGDCLPRFLYPCGKTKWGLEMKYLKQWGLVDINIPYVFVRLLILTNHAREVRHAV